ncbi:hypothetical protein KUTeg_018619 [Tegillarca granosa]|uniref:Centromere protein I n=1 Tax=Tegillarca granosa TaxID=220873 RepID=A0ABQ9EHD0_TEGGR|nr:hypothetical protein KUTeg_018619 [Tegillarca granosa]
MSRKRRSTDKLQEAVEFFTKATGPIKVRGNVELKLSLDLLTEKSRTVGLNTEHIEDLIDVAASAQQAETISSKLIRVLIPSTYVPVGAVVKAISHMCTNKPSSAIQSLILRWILLVYDYIDDKEKIHKLYGLIFYFLENQVLMPHVCHLLFLLTRKEDIKMFRVRHLLNLQTRIGPQPYLTGLLSIYKLYFPNLVSVCLPRTKRIFFPMRDHQWSSTIKKVQEYNQSGQVEHSLSVSGINTTERSYIQGTQSAHIGKKRKLDPVPVIHSNASKEIVDPRDDITKLLEFHRIPYVQIGDFQQLLDKVDRIEFPSQIGAVLRCPVLQHLMSYSGDKVTTCRFSYWIQATLSDEILDHSTNTEDIQRNEKFLDQLIRFMDFIQEGVPVVEQFLSRFLHTWNGFDYRPQVFRLITRCRLQSFNKLNDTILEPLRKLFFCSSVYFKCQTILCLTELLRNMVACEWPRYLEMYIENVEDTEMDDSRPQYFTGLFLEEKDNFKPVTAVEDLIQYTSRLCTLALQIEQNHCLLQHCILDFFDLVSTLRQKYDFPCSLFPSLNVFVRPFFSDNGMGITRVCTIITNNALWRGAAFMSLKEDQAFFNFDPAHYDQSPNRDVFSMYMHQGMLGYAWMFLKETQPAENKGHPKGIKAVKDVFLNFLEREYMNGIPEFIRSFIRRSQRKSLKENEKPLP